ncbi:MAG: DNA polymerase III subunit delta' [Armatimonadota bacterium]
MIIGQDKAINYLNRIIDEKKVANSYLFFGPEGVGKKTAAAWFAKKINCRSASSPCNECSSCTKINKNIHPDILYIKPEGNYIKIDQTREILSSISFRPFEGKYRAYIIEDAQYLTDAAANQMLKILEEPPSYAVIILIISDITHLAPTVISRCQRVPFNYVESRLIKEYIHKNFDLDQARTESVAKLSRGSLGQAVSFINNDRFWEVREFTLRLGSELPDMSYDKALKEAQSIENLKGYEEAVLEFLIDWFRDLMVLKETGNPGMVINYDMKDKLSAMAGNYTVWQIKKIMRKILEAKFLLRRNVNKKIIFNNLVLNIASLKPEAEYVIQ